MLLSVVQSYRYSNSTKILCMSSLYSNRDKVETLIFYTLKGGLLRSQWWDLAKIRTQPNFYACPRYLRKCEDPIQNDGQKSSPSISLWGESKGTIVATTFPKFNHMGASC